VQVLAHACWDHLRAGQTAKENTLSREVVEQSLDRVVRQYDPFYTQLWNGLTAIQQKTLRKEAGVRAAIERSVSRCTLIADFIIDGGFMSLRSRTDEGA
jgi:hypothetical protein